MQANSNLVAAAHLAGSYQVSQALIDGAVNPILGVQYFVPFQIAAWQKVYGNLYANAADVFNAPYDSYYKNYHSAYEAPLCSSEARKFIDQYR